MSRITNWEKWNLLIWKNFIIQWNAKRATIFELILPTILFVLFLLVRLFNSPEDVLLLTYPAITINKIGPFQNVSSSLYYSPENPFLEKIVKLTVETLQLTGSRSYPNSLALEKALMKDNVLAGIEFDDRWSKLKDYPKNFSFALRFPSEMRGSKEEMTWSTTALFIPPGKLGPRIRDDADGGYPLGYLGEGFIAVQNALTMSYIELVTGRKDLPNIDMQRYPYPPHISDQMTYSLLSGFSFLLLLSFMYSAISIVRYVTAEKEKQLKEIMKIMGLGNWIHWLAWFVKSVIMMGIPLVLIVILMKIPLGNVSLLMFCSWSVLLVFMLVYMLASICFCFMMASFYSKANTAAIGAGLLWLASFLPYLMLVESYTLGLGSKLGWCLISNTALGLGLNLIVQFETIGVGSQWSNLFKPVNKENNLTVGYIILTMLGSCVLYMCICLYLEQVFPGDFGVPRKWYFLFTSQFWCGENDEDEDLSNVRIKRRNPNAFEPDPVGQRIGLQVRNLKKEFEGTMAVNGFSINMYENEITVLLGHNGAGKTTTISMLTGMLPPTYGTAIINGYDIRTNINGARQSLGICPQHNVLFDELTVAQHLKFFSRLKGLKGEAIHEEVDKYIKLIKLEDKRNVVAKKLSGGMKRKLSVCCALTGNSKTVLLDEPSSGLDPAARRQLWDLLHGEKSGRTILLTTHFMDEADVLGDRIAIMCDGVLKCHGTSFFLKKKYGSGYRLICVKRSDCNSANITALLRKYIPDINPESEVGSELTYQLPDSYSSQFEKMLGNLEDQSDDLRLNGYGISITTLEEVFMKVGAENAHEKSRKRNRDAGDDVESFASDSLFSENKRLFKGAKLLCSQWHAMLLKKFLNASRHKLLFMFQFLIPILTFILTLSLMNTAEYFGNVEPMTIGLDQYSIAVIVLETAPDVAAGSLQQKISDKYQAIARSYGSNFEFQTTGKQNFSSYILDLGRILQSRINERYLASATITNDKITAWLNNEPLHTAPLTVNLVHNAIMKAIMNDSYDITVTNAPLPYTAKTKLEHLRANHLGTTISSQICFSFCFVTAIFIFFLITERETRYKLLQFVGGVKIWTFWLSHFLWDLLIYFLIVIIILGILALNHVHGLATFPELARYFLVFFLFGCSALLFTYVISFLFNDAATGFIRLFILNIFLGKSLALIRNFRLFQLFVFILFLTGPVPCLMLSTDESQDISFVNTISSVLRIYPHFSLKYGLSNLYVNVIARETCAESFAKLPDDVRCKLVPVCCTTTPFFDWNYPGALKEVVYLAATAVISVLLIILKEYNACRKLKQLYYRYRKIYVTPHPPFGDVDEDVTAENRRIRNMSSSDRRATNLVLDRVTKYYKNFLAVNQVSLCVKPVECFGLLGVNGAGKTTTFKMMTGDEDITYGIAYVKGMNLVKEMNKIRKDIGYCPQFDAILEDFTGRENMKIICLIRGIHRNRIESISEELAKSFGFSKYLDEQTKKYSGGNKRKLSTAIAVIGSPSIVYLDEPTTGMDPTARRRLWNMVCRIRDSGKSIVLTSHSMEECEALCTRLAIMVNAEFKCIGSTQHLKNKFSKGLVLKVKIKRNADSMQPTGSFFQPNSHSRKKTRDKRDIDSNISDKRDSRIKKKSKSKKIRNKSEADLLESDLNMVSLNAIETAQSSYDIDSIIENVKDFVAKEFPEAVLEEAYQGMLTFHIPLSIIKWSRIFGIMEQNREALNIEDYSLSQTTLEEIFLEFARHQKDDHRLQKSSICC